MCRSEQDGKYAALTIASQNSYILYSIYFLSRRGAFRTLLRTENSGGKKENESHECENATNECEDVSNREGISKNDLNNFNEVI